jgi:hypothetical protein
VPSAISIRIIVKLLDPARGGLGDVRKRVAQPRGVAMNRVLLMPSTPFVYPQVGSLLFASFRVVKPGFSAGQRTF